MKNAFLLPALLMVSTLSGVPLDGFGLVGDTTRVNLEYKPNFLELTVR